MLRFFTALIAQFWSDRSRFLVLNMKFSLLTSALHTEVALNGRKYQFEFVMFIVSDTVMFVCLVSGFWPNYVLYSAENLVINKRQYLHNVNNSTNLLQGYPVNSK